MKVKHTQEEPIYFDHYDAEALSDIIDTQHKIIDYEKTISYKTSSDIGYH